MSAPWSSSSVARKAVDEFLRQVPDETDRIGDDRLGIPGKAEARALRVERGEEAVLGEDLAFRQGV